MPRDAAFERARFDADRQDVVAAQDEIPGIAAPADPFDRPRSAEQGDDPVADLEVLDRHLAGGRQDQGPWAIARRRVFGDQSAAEPVGSEVEVVAGEVLAGSEVDVVGAAVLGYHQHIAAGQIDMPGAAVEGDAAQIEAVARDEAGHRGARDRRAVDLVGAARPGEADGTADDATRRDIERAAADHRVARGTTGRNELRAAAQDRRGDRDAARFDDLGIAAADDRAGVDTGDKFLGVAVEDGPAGAAAGQHVQRSVIRQEGAGGGAAGKHECDAAAGDRGRQGAAAGKDVFQRAGGNRRRNGGAAREDVLRRTGAERGADVLPGDRVDAEQPDARIDRRALRRNTDAAAGNYRAACRASRGNDLAAAAAHHRAADRPAPKCREDLSADERQPAS